MKKLLAKTDGAVYEHVTGHVVEQISYFIADAVRHGAPEAESLLHNAYGLYLGWRAFAAEMTSPERFHNDDQYIERMVNQLPMPADWLSFAPP